MAVTHISTLDEAPATEPRPMLKPEWFAGMRELRLAKPLGLTQFGVNHVTLAPGAATALRHWHAAEDEFVYVLEGTIVMGLQGGREVTLTRGQTFYEGPDDIHVVGRNASSTEPARFTVTLVKKKGVDFFIPVQDAGGGAGRHGR